MNETFHIEFLATDEPDPRDPAILHRVTLRSDGLAAAQERALRLFARARVPQRGGDRPEAVRILDGAGREVYRRSRFEAPEA